MRPKHIAVLVPLVCLSSLALVGGAAAQDGIGVVDGVSYDEEFDFDTDGNLTDEQLEAVVSRSMARVERIREREFKRRPTIERIEREDVPGSNSTVNRTEQGNWNDVVWEALLIIGEDKYANQEIADTFGGATSGFFQNEGGGGGNSSGNGTGGRGSVSLVGGVEELTLAHELVHVMQSQYYNLSAERLNPPVQDEQLSTDGVVEGEAEYIRALYARRCRTEWDCVTGDRGSGGGGGSASEVNRGVLAVALHPYSDGPQYIHELVQDGGWEAVDEAFEDPPTSSREIIHREPHRRANISFSDEARAGWELFDAGRNGYDVAGEASVFVGFWYQSHPVGYNLGIIDARGFTERDGRFSGKTYVSEPSEGLAGDRIYPYHRETDGGNETGYVWLTVWDTPEDAREFANAHVRVLEARDAKEVGDATWTVEGDFQGAYRIVRDGTNVTVVHAPTVEGLGEIRPSVGDDTEFYDVLDARPVDPRPLDGMGGVAAVVSFAAVLLLVRRRG